MRHLIIDEKKSKNNTILLSAPVGGFSPKLDIKKISTLGRAKLFIGDQFVTEFRDSVEITLHVNLIRYQNIYLVVEPIKKIKRFLKSPKYLLPKVVVDIEDSTVIEETYCQNFTQTFSDDEEVKNLLYYKMGRVNVFLKNRNPSI